MNRTTRERMELRAEMIGRLLPSIGSRIGRSWAGGVSAASWTGIGSSRADRVVRVRSRADLRFYSVWIVIWEAEMVLLSSWWTRDKIRFRVLVLDRRLRLLGFLVSILVSGFRGYRADNVLWTERWNRVFCSYSFWIKVFPYIGDTRDE